MKNILIPVDYSPASRNAANYGLAYAKEKGAKVILVHVFHIPVVVSETPVAIPDFTELEKASLNEMERYVNELKANGTLPEMETLVRPGFVQDELAQIVEEYKIGLIIMGIKGAGKVAEVVVGSNTTAIMREFSCPTIAVPMDAVYKPIKSIVFACDLEKITDDEALAVIKKWVKDNDAKLYLLNVVEKAQQASFSKAVSGITLEHVFEQINHSLHFIENDDLVFAINDFVDKHAVDLVIMIPKKHGFVYSLFHESNTKKMAFHTHTPLMAVH